MRLTENTAERANGNVAFPGYNRDVNDFSKSPRELDMAAALALDLAEGLRITPPQPPPFESEAGALHGPVQASSSDSP